MGGKTGTTTSSVAIPPEVLARYNDVNKQAQATAGTPFQQYSTDPNAFVAPLNQQQNAGIGGINQYANAAQPAYGAAMQGTANAYQGFNAPNYQQGVQEYMNPFLQNAMGSTAAQMQNVNQQQQQQLLGQGISAGAFGGDRGKVAQAALMNQQNLALGNTLGNMASSGYQNAAQNYITGLGQQGALAGQMGALGAGAQTAGLQGAQAQLGAGTLGQQTTQAGQSALYNQFQQQQAYPFQVSQFLANIAEGTGALSGSTTTQTAPQSFFSDARLKEDIKRVGTAHNGLPIYTFKYKGDNAEQTHIGYMAQDVEKVHPEAVGESHGYKTVDYDKASEPAHKYAGGVVGNSEGGAVMPQHMGQGFAVGGDVVSPTDLSALLAQQQQSYAPFQQAGIYGGQSGGTPHGGAAGVVPAGNLHVSKLQPAQISNAQQGDTLMGDVQQVENIGDRIKKANEYRKDIIGHPAVAAQAAVPANAQTGAAAQPAVAAQDATGLEWLKQYLPQGQAHGGVVGYASGGGVEPYQTDDPMSQVVSDTEQDKNKHGLMTAQNPTGQPSSTLGDLGKIASLAALPGEIASGAGAAASGIGSLMAMLAPIGLASGGVVPREHHAGPDDTNGQSNVVGNGDQTPAPDDYTVNAAKELLRQREGLLTNAKYDTNAYRTGYGSDTVTQPDGTVVPVKSDTSITKDDAERDLARRTGITQNDIQSKIGADAWAKLTPDARVALTSTAYNYGSLPDSVAGATKSGNPADIATAINNLGGDNEGINAVRRSKEASLIDPQGKYDPMAPQPKVSAATAPNATAPKSFGDALMEKAQDPDVLLSILSGLGTMAGSNSRYLGAAILQGIGGGADTYKSLQSQKSQIGLQQSEIFKNTYGLVNTRFQPLLGGKFFDSTTNQTIDAAERAKRIMSMGIPPQMAAMIAGGTTPTDTTTAQGGTEQPKPTGVVPAAGAPIPESAPTGKDLGSVTATTVAAQPPTTEGTTKVAAQPTATTTGESVTKTADQGDILAPSTGLYAKIDQLPDVAKAKSEYTSLMSQADEQSKMARSVIDDPRSQAPAFAGALKTAQDQMASANQLRANAVSQLENWRSLRSGYAKLPEEKLAQIQAYMGQPHEVTSSDGVTYQIPGDILYPLLNTADENGMIKLPNGRMVYTKMPLAMAEEQKIKGTPQTVYDKYGQSRVIPGDQFLAGIKSSNGNGVFVTPDGETVSTGTDPFAKTKVTNYEEQYTGSNNVIKTWPTLRTKIVELSHIYQNFQANRATPLWADLNSWMVGIGMKPVNPKASAGFDAAIKSAMDQAITSTQEFAHNAPATGGNMAMQASADPIRDPDALYKNLTDRLGFGDYEYKRAIDFMQQHPKDVGAWNADFNEKNKPQTFLDAAHGEVKGFVGGTPEGSKAAGMPVEKGAPPEENVVTVPNNASQKDIFDLANNTPINKRLRLPDGSYIWGQKK